MISPEWLELLKNTENSFSIGASTTGLPAIFLDGALFMTLTPPMSDYDLRIKDMNKAGVDVAIVSLTCPSVYWGGAQVSAKAAGLINRSMAQAQRAYPDRIRWFATLPWEYPELANAELARAVADGAVGVMVLANVAGRSLTDEHFAPIWEQIDALGLPVLCHPGTPPGLASMDMKNFGLVATVGFCFDTTLAVARMLYSGFFAKYPNLKLIAAHGGGTLPYLAGRLDAWYHKTPDCQEYLHQPPSEALSNVYFDSVVYRADALELCLKFSGADNLLYGSDYPHYTGDMVGCLDRVRQLPSAVAKNVACKNAERIFRI
jgi:aminocarboxymuconate-semialdehyde decarboxylase